MCGLAQHFLLYREIICYFTAELHQSEPKDTECCLEESTSIENQYEMKLKRGTNLC